MQDVKQYVPVYCNQLEYNPYKGMQPVLAYLQQHDILFTAYSPLARGAVLREPVIKALAAKHNKTGSQVVVRWLLQQNVAAIPKALTPKHTLENIQVFDFELSERDMQDIGTLQKT